MLRHVGETLKGTYRDVVVFLYSLRLRIIYYMEDYKVFFGTAINMLLTFIGYYIFWSVILANTGVFKGVYLEWSIGRILVLIGFAELAFAIDALITFGLADIPRIIHEEGLEPYSIYPVSSLTVILGKHSEPIDGVAGVIWSIVFIATARLIYNVSLTLTGFIAGFILCFTGVLLIGAIYLAIASLSFRYGMLESPIDLITTTYVSFARVPHDIFPYSIRLFLTLVLPVALLSTYPSLLSLNALSPGQAMKLFLLAAIAFSFWLLSAYYLWSTGKKKYQPVGG